MKKTAFASSALSVMTLVLGLLFMLHQIPYSNYIIALSLPGAELIITGGLFLFAILFIHWYAYRNYKKSIS